MTCQLSDAQPQLLVPSLEAEEPGLADGTLLKLLLLRGAKQQVLPLSYFPPQILLYLHPSLEEEPTERRWLLSKGKQQRLR